MANYVSQITPTTGGTYDIRELFPHIGTCETAAGTAAKTVTIGNFKLYTGAWVVVKFVNTNTAAAASLTLNVDGTGAKSIKYKNANLSNLGMLAANKYTYFMYDGTNYQIVEPEMSDTKVTQTAVGSTYTNYRPLVMGTANSATRGFSPATSTDQTYTTQPIYAQPSSGFIHSTGRILDAHLIKTDSETAQKHITFETLFNWMSSTKGIISTSFPQHVSFVSEWNYANSDILQVSIGGTNYEIQLAGCVFEFIGTATAYNAGVFRFRIHSSPTVSFTPASGYTKFPVSHVAEYTCNGSSYSPTWKMLTTSDHTHSEYLPLSGGTLTGRVTTSKFLNYIVKGTGTAGADKGSGQNPRYVPAKWTFNTSQTPSDGDIILVKIPVAGHDYGVYISIDNGTNYHPAVVTGTSRLTTHYANGNYAAFIFKSDGSAASMIPLAGNTDGTRVTVSGGVWQGIDYYDSGNTYDRTSMQTRIYAGGVGVFRYSLCAMNNSQRMESFTTTGDANGSPTTTKTFNTSAHFMYPPVIMYNSANAVYSNGSAVGNNVLYEQFPSLDLRYSCNKTSSSGFAQYKPLYIECTLNSDNTFSITTNGLTQTFATGKYYILLGCMYNTSVYQLALFAQHPMFYYDGTNLNGVVFSAAEKTKLAGIEDQANKYVHPSGFTVKSTAGFYKYTVNTNGHVTAGDALTKADITALGIPGSDTNTTYTFATGDAVGQFKVKASTASAYTNYNVNGINAGTSSGTANLMAYYSSANTISSTPRVAYHEVDSAATTPVKRAMLNIFGVGVGNDAGQLISATEGVLSYGDGGPQINFNTLTSDSVGGGQDGAIIFTDHDKAGAGVSWHFVSNQTDWNVISKRFHARTAVSIGTDKPVTSHNLYVSGTTNITGNTTIGGTLAVTGAITQNGTAVSLNGHTHDSLAIKNLATRAAVDGTAGNFFFKTSALAAGSSADWVGIQADAGNEKFQLIPYGGSLLYRNDDSGGTSTTWEVPFRALQPLTNVTGSAGITVEYGTVTIGTGDDKITFYSGATVKHSNSITASSSKVFKKFSYDAYGHITGIEAVAKGDIPALDYLPISGGTLTGPLTLKAEQYSGNYGMDCNNSNVIGVNALRFNDNSESYTEGISFPRTTATYYDTIYANDGKLYFTANHTLDQPTESSSAGTTYTVLHSGNVVESSNNGKIKVNNSDLTVYTHPNSFTAKSTAGFYKYTVNTNGHVTAGDALAKADITALGIPAQDTTYSAGNHLSLSSTTFSLASYCKTITDWNDAKTTGWYMGSGVTNAPSSAWWMGRVTAHNAKYCIQEVWQFTASTDGHKVPHKMRMYVNEVWGNWVDITVGTAVPENAVFTDTKYGISGAYGSGSKTWVTTLTAGGTGTSSTVPTASTSVYGITKLYNGVDSTSTELAATANAVKTAYDKGNHSHPYLSNTTKYALSSSVGGPALTHLTESLSDTTSSHATVLQTYFTNNVSTVTRNQQLAFYSRAYSNGSMYMGYFLSSYDETPYGGFFVAHYNDPYYVGIQRGTFTQYPLLTQRTLTPETMDTVTGTFAFDGTNLLGGTYDWAGLQVDAGNDAFQMTINSTQLVIRQNDANTKTTANWGSWRGCLTPANVSGSGGITVTENDTTIGSGASALTYKGSVTISHSNSITAQTSTVFKKFSYDANGHITGVAAVAKGDIPALDYVPNTQTGVNNAINLLGEGTSDVNMADYYVSQYVNGGTTTKTYHRRAVGHLWNTFKTYITTTTTGSGNAITAASIANDGSYGRKITFTKGKTFSEDGHTHAYVPLAGGTMNNDASITFPRASDDRKTIVNYGGLDIYGSTTTAWAMGMRFYVGSTRYMDFGGYGGSNQFGYLFIGTYDAPVVKFTTDKKSQFYGDIVFDKQAVGVWIKDAKSTLYPMIRDNAENTWIGAQSTTSYHHNGQVFISAGWKTGTSLPASSSDKLQAYETIRISVPRYTYGASSPWNGTNYYVIHDGPQLTTGRYMISSSEAVPPIHRAMFPSMRGNKFSFIPASNITVEYSTNGTSWVNMATDVSGVNTAITNEQKVSLTTGKKDSANIPVGPNGGTARTTSMKTRITFKITDRDCCIDQFMLQYGPGYHALSLDIQTTTSTSDTGWSSIKQVAVGTWKYQDVINIAPIRIGNTVKQVRFIFTYTTVDSSKSTNRSFVYDIAAYGGQSMWTYANYMANNDHLYDWDWEQNATFPNTVYSKRIITTDSAIPTGMDHAQLDNNALIFESGSETWRSGIIWTNSRGLEINALGVVGQSVSSQYLWIGGFYDAPDIKITGSEIFAYNNLVLHNSSSDGGASPAIEFRRGATDDQYTDWQIYDAGGDLCFKKISSTGETIKFIMSESNGLFGSSDVVYENSAGFVNKTDMTLWSYAKYLKVVVKDFNTSTYAIHDVVIESGVTCALSQHATTGSSGLGIKISPLQFTMSVSSGKWSISLATGTSVQVNASQTPYAGTASIKMVKIIQCC